MAEATYTHEILNLYYIFYYFRLQKTWLNYASWIVWWHDNELPLNIWICRNYCGKEVTNIFVILNIHFATWSDFATLWIHFADVYPQKIVHWCHIKISRSPGDVAVLWISSSSPSSWEIFLQAVALICRPVWRCSILHEDVLIWIVEFPKLMYVLSS